MSGLVGVVFRGPRWTGDYPSQSDVSKKKAESVGQGRSARQVKRAAFHVPWTEACEIVGGEGRLREILGGTGRRKSISDYQRDVAQGGGVPIQEIGKELMGWWRRRFRAVIKKVRDEGYSVGYQRGVDDARGALAGLAPPGKGSGAPALGPGDAAQKAHGTGEVR